MSEAPVMSESINDPASSDSPVVELRDVSVWFADGTVALEKINLSVAPGEFVAIVGPSGCGKSTLLRLVSGLASPSAGELTRRTDDVGYVFQDPTLLPWRSVRRNVELFCELRRLPRSRRRELATEALARVGLTEFANHLPHALSGGMRMRVALARAMTLRPSLFLFDEPFAALDEITRNRLAEHLQELFTAERFAALFVTHSVLEAAYLASRVVVMSPRPAQIVGEVPIDLPFPRPPEARFSAKLTEAASQIAELLRRHGPAQLSAPGGQS